MIFLLFFLIFLSACLSGSETALFSLSPMTLKSYARSDQSRLKGIAKMMQKPRQVLVTILILNILANILIQNTASILFDSYESFFLSVGVPLVLTLFLGELLPKSLALPNHTKVAYFAFPWVHMAAKMLRFLREPMTKATSFISRFLFFFLKEEKEISADELKHVLKASEKRGVLLPIESHLIGGTLDLQHSQIKEHMRPREEVLFYDLQKELNSLVPLFVEKGISKVPVSEGGLENLKGILPARQYFFHQEKIKEPRDLLSLLQKPVYFPESMNGWAALRSLREKGISLAIVVDEYGSISGLVTQEDLMEAVTGEILDERDEKDLYTRSGKDIVIASGKLELSEFKEIFDTPLTSKEHVVTLGGWLIEQLGDIPKAGTKYATDHFLFYILAAEPNRIRRVYVRRLH